jgi:hypothetical protein
MSTIARNYFDRSLIPPAKTFYERELGQLGRPDRKGWAAANCPFHRSKTGRSFSINLDSGGFHCFGCDAKGGDVISFAEKRYGLSFKDACIQLGCWLSKGPDAETQKRLREQREARERQRKEDEERKEQSRQQRIAARDELHGLENQYSAAGIRLGQLLRGQRQRYRGEQELGWWFLVDLLPRIRIVESRYRRLAGLEDAFVLL